MQVLRRSIPVLRVGVTTYRNDEIVVEPPQSSPVKKKTSNDSWNQGLNQLSDFTILFTSVSSRATKAPVVPATEATMNSAFLNSAKKSEFSLAAVAGVFSIILMSCKSIRAQESFVAPTTKENPFFQGPS